MTEVGCSCPVPVRQLTQKAEKLHLSNSLVTHLPAGATARGLHSALCLAAGLALHQHAHILRPLALPLVLVPLLGALALLAMLPA